jgi:hypothetical protein
MKFRIVLPFSIAAVLGALAWSQSSHLAHLTEKQAQHLVIGGVISGLVLAVIICVLAKILRRRPQQQQARPWPSYSGRK